MIELFKYLKGYVCICVTGFSPERFMNLCGNRGILLWDIRKEQDKFYMSLSLAGFYQLRPIVRKTGTKVAIVKRCGLPFFVSGLKRRKFFLIGFLLAAAFWFVTSRYIWAVDIQGNFSITEDLLVDYLKENNVYVGMKKSALDIENLEKGIRKEFYQVTWTSVKLDGTKLAIEIKENELLDAENLVHPNNNDTNKGNLASDLVAEADGVIVSMIVREGVPQVSAGQKIKKGDILVSGSIPVFREDGTIRKYRYCEADADIYIEHTLNVSETLQLDYEKKIYTGREKTQRYLNIWGKTIRFGTTEPSYLLYDFVTRETQLQILPDFYLPVSYGKYVFREYYMKEEKYTDEEAKMLLNEKYTKFVSTLEEKGVQIIGKDVKIETNDLKWVLRCVFNIQEKTGKSIPVETVRFEEEIIEE